MNKQRILRLLVFVIVVGMILVLGRFPRKESQRANKVLSAQVEKIIKELTALPEKGEISSLKDEILGKFKKEEEKIGIEKKVEEIVEEIKSLPKEQLDEFKQEVCQEVCE